jgi:hypothetical protein
MAPEKVFVELERVLNERYPDPSERPTGPNDPRIVAFIRYWLGFQINFVHT